MISDQRYKQDSKIKETEETKKTESVYETTTEEATGYLELGECHDNSNYDKLSWVIHLSPYCLFS